MKSKTIILSALNSHSPRAGRGILTLSSENNTLTAKLRLYNIDSLNQNSKLGIYYNHQVYSTALLSRSGYYEGKIQKNFDMNEDFYCAVIDKDKSNDVIIAGGTYAGCFFDDSSVFFENENQDDYETNNYENDSDLESNINSNQSNKTIEKTQDHEKCAHCIYKETFYSQKEENLNNSTEKTTPTTLSNNIQENNNVNLKNNEDEKLDKDTEKSIINSIIPQFDYIFENYPADEELNNLIENGKFVKINDANQSYSIGAMYENDKIKYICYAVRTNYNSPIPEELGKYHQWLPIDTEDPLSEGYHIVYQDATDLKIIEVWTNSAVCEIARKLAIVSL